ncbi:replication initiation protein, partial [Klebsiella michiganensis]
MFKIENNKDILKSQIPLKPYATNNLDFGLTIQNKNKALDMLYLQVNHPLYLHTMIFDLDKENCFYEFENAHLPIPSFITKSPESGRCHYGYMLNAPITSTEKSRQKPVKFARAVYFNMATRLGADLGYAGLITKNPMNSHWSPFWSGADLYELNDLADCFDDLEEPKKRENTGLAFGRNVEMFDTIRQWAYKNVLKYKSESSFNDFHNELLLKCQMHNAYLNANDLLPYNEIKATSKSIAKWCWSKFENEAFSKIQSNRA